MNLQEHIRKVLREEMDDFDFIGDIPELHGVSFKVENFDKPIYTILDNGDRYYVNVTWIDPIGKTASGTYKRSMVMKLLRDGTWVPVV